MSAAATAAGYLYASGRLRGRTGKEGETPASHDNPKPRAREVKVAVVEREQEREPEPMQAAPRPKAAPKIQYRTRRWKPE
jgi:hypothetical protein